MQSQAIPYGTWAPGSSGRRHVSPATARDQPVAVASRISSSRSAEAAAGVQKRVSENAVTVVGRRGCCMCHVVKRLLIGHGVNPAVFEVEEDDEAAVVEVLRKKILAVGSESKEEMSSNWAQSMFPVVFVGGKLFGGLERVMATHISGELVPILKQAGALWL